LTPTPEENHHILSFLLTAQGLTRVFLIKSTQFNNKIYTLRQNDIIEHYIQPPQHQPLLVQYKQQANQLLSMHNYTGTSLVIGWNDKK
jgi:hypothetical protein